MDGSTRLAIRGLLILVLLTPGGSVRAADPAAVPEAHGFGDVLLTRGGDAGDIALSSAELAAARAALDGRTIGMVVTGGASEGERTTASTAQRVLEEHGASVEVCDAGMSAVSAASCVAGFIESGVLAIVSTAPGAAIGDAAAQAVAAGIPVVLPAGSVPAPVGAVAIGFDESVVGRQAAEVALSAVVDRWPGEAVDAVMVASTDAGVGTVVAARADAIRGVLSEAQPSIDVAGSVAIGGDALSGMPDARLFIALDESSGVALVRELEAAGRAADAALVGVGCPVVLRARIDHKGVAAACVDTHPDAWGSLAADAIARLASGADVPATITVPATPYTGTNESREGPALLDEIGPDGEVGADLALRAFVDVFGPLPGLDLVPTSDPKGVPDATLAALWMLDHLDALDPVQLAAVQAIVAPRSGRAGASPLVASIGGPGTTRGSTRNDRPRIEGTPPPLILQTVNQVLDLYAAKGHELPDDFTLWVTLNNDQQFGADTKGFAFPVYQGKIGASERNGCDFYLNPLALNSVDVTLEVTVAHELWHCFQYAYLGARPRPASWIIEGQAEWAMTNLIPGQLEVPHAVDFRGRYLTSASYSLFRRSYGAIGFFSQLEHVGRDPWLFMADMLRASGNVAAYNVAVANDLDFADSSGSSHWRFPRLGRDWESGGNALPPVMDARSLASVVTATNGSRETVIVEPFTNGLEMVEVKADVVRLVARGRVHFSDRLLSGTNDIPGLLSAWLCSPAEWDRTECACPGDEVIDEPPLDVPELVLLGSTGGLGGVRLTVKGYSLEDYCKEVDAAAHGEWPGETIACNLLTESDVAALVENLPMKRSDGRARYDPETGWTTCAFRSDIDAAQHVPLRDVSAQLVIADPDRPMADLTAPMKGCQKPLCQPVPALGPHAKSLLETYFGPRLSQPWCLDYPPGVPDEYKLTFKGGKRCTGGGRLFDSSSGGTFVVFACGRRSCMLQLSVTAAPHDKQKAIREDAFALASIIQGRARTLPPVTIVDRGP